MESLYLLTGENCCGKDFFYTNRENLCDYFTIEPCLSLDKDYVRVAFADPIKISLGVSINNITCSGLPRELIIQTANEIKSLYGNDIFAQIAINKILSENLKKVIITDLRFINEYTLLKKIFPHLKVISILNNPHGFDIDYVVHRKLI